MTAATPTRAFLQGAFRDACLAELDALKPGNVHRHGAGHGMDVAHFERAAEAAAPFIADPSLSVGARILKATQASFAATGLNTNLGIVLLCAPLAKAAAETGPGMGLRRALSSVLAQLTLEDARDAFAAIRLANPGGLGRVKDGDVSTDAPQMTLLQAMQLGAARDRIANAYVTAYADIFDFAWPVYAAALPHAEADPSLAVTALHMALLAEFPDSHILRKYGAETAAAVQHEAAALRPLWHPCPAPKTFAKLLSFDRELKARSINPGTTADFVVATLFSAKISDRKHA